MNEAKFNSLPQEDQQAIEGLSGEAFATLCGKAWDVADQEGLQAAQKAGNSITEASPEMVANLREELSVLESEWIAAAGGKGVGTTRDSRAEETKYELQSI